MIKTEKTFIQYNNTFVQTTKTFNDAIVSEAIVHYHC